MNQFDAYISEFLLEHKEAALDKIGIVKIISPDNTQPVSAEFTCQKKTATSPALVNFIAEKTRKNKNLIASDLDSHLAQVREFINIGKSYEIPGVGFIKSNNAGMYEFLPYSDANKSIKTTLQPVKKEKRNTGINFIQVITFLIVIAILSGLGWQVYDFYSKGKANGTASTTLNNTDTVTKSTVKDTAATFKDTNTASTPSAQSYSPGDSLNVKYIFETTASGLRARTRTMQLKSFGNNAGYDSFVSNKTKFYNLFIIKPTKAADTLAVKDSLGKFLMRDVKIIVEPPRQ